MDNDNLYQIESFLINFRYFSKIMHQKFNAYLKKNDVDCSEFICLLLLNREKDGLSMAELTKMSKVDKSMTTKIIKKLEEKDKDRKEKRYFSAFKLIVGCLVFLGIIYIIDTIVTIAFGKTSDATNSIIEIIKTLLFTLSGYLFARKENGD